MSTRRGDRRAAGHERSSPSPPAARPRRDRALEHERAAGRAAQVFSPEARCRSTVSPTVRGGCEHCPARAQQPRAGLESVTGRGRAVLREQRHGVRWGGSAPRRQQEQCGERERALGDSSATSRKTRHDDVAVGCIRRVPSRPRSSSSLQRGDCRLGGRRYVSGARSGGCVLQCLHHGAGLAHEGRVPSR